MSNPKTLPQQQMNVTDPGAIFQNQYSDESQAAKSAEAGLNWKPLGPANVRTRIAKGTPVLFFNSASSVAYVAFDNTDQIATPTGPTNGIPVLPNSFFVLNSGMDTYFIATAATVFAYAPELFEAQD